MIFVGGGGIWGSPRICGGHMPPAPRSYAPASTPMIIINCVNFIRQWDLVCDAKNLPDYAQSVFYVGYLVGAFLFGVLADK